MLVLFVCAFSSHIMAQKTTKSKTLSSTTLSADDVPPPPLPPPPDMVKFTPPVIVNDKGYDISVHYNNGNNMVYMKKKAVTEKVSMTKWNANKSFYENKYGKIPPPPPPPPATPAPPAPDSK